MRHETWRAGIAAWLMTLCLAGTVQANPGDEIRPGQMQSGSLLMRMALLGGSERMDAQAALACGLVGEVLAPDALLPRALELAEKISQHSPTALARSKRAIWESLDRGLYEGLRHAWDIIGVHGSSPDMREGAMAFIEKRKPRWAPYSE